MLICNKWLKIAALYAFGCTLNYSANADTNDGQLARPGAREAAPTELAAPASVVRIHAVALLANGNFATSRARDSIDVISATRLSVGSYEVIFRNRRLHVDCFWTGSIADRDDGTVLRGFIGLDARTGTNNGIFVQTTDTAGALADRPFILTVICAN